ncbi:hypothetical protein Acsp05_15040 [Actinokineospora sp. NBRC 105648]|nr:hypothetical protein Acsp05_15040 [Actinokineospora sp. NBRC 105648]
MNNPTALYGLLGLGTGLGLVLLVRWWRGDTSAKEAFATPTWRTRWRVRYRGQHTGRRLAIAGAMGLGVGVLTGWIVGALLTALAAWALPRLVGSDPARHRHIDRIEAVAGWTEMLRDTLAAAAGLEQAIIATARVAPTPIRAQILEVSARVESGDRLAPSLRRLADDLNDPTADLVINALIAAAERQARQLAALLGRLADIARDRVEMRRRVETGRARTRTTLRVVVITFAVFAGGLIVFNPKFLAPYSTAGGQVVLLLIGALFVVAFGWLRRMAHIEEPERILTNFDATRDLAAHEEGRT